MIRWMRYSLRQRESFERILKSPVLEKALGFFQCEHRLILIRVKISTNDKPIYHRNFCSEEVAGMSHQLINSYLALSNVLSRLGLFVPMGN